MLVSRRKRKYISTPSHPADKDSTFPFTRSCSAHTHCIAPFQHVRTTKGRLSRQGCGSTILRKPDAHTAAADLLTAVDAVEKKVGGATGHNIDPAKYRDKNEKFTDKLRGFFEKKTGKKASLLGPASSLPLTDDADAGQGVQLVTAQATVGREDSTIEIFSMIPFDFYHDTIMSTAIHRVG